MVRVGKDRFVRDRFNKDVDLDDDFDMDDINKEDEEEKIPKWKKIQIFYN